MSTYEFEYMDVVHGGADWDGTSEDWGVAKVAVLPMGERTKARLLVHYRDIEQCTHFLLMSQMNGVDEGEPYFNIVVMPVARDMSSGYDTPFLEMEYSDDNWVNTIQYIVLDEFRV